MLETTVLGLIETLYAAASDPQQWPVFLDGFGAAVSGNIVGFVVQDLKNSTAQLTLTNVDPSAISVSGPSKSSAAYWRRVWPAITNISRARDGAHRDGT